MVLFILVSSSAILTGDFISKSLLHFLIKIIFLTASFLGPCMLSLIFPISYLCFEWSSLMLKQNLQDNCSAEVQVAYALVLFLNKECVDIMLVIQTTKF